MLKKLISYPYIKTVIYIQLTGYTKFKVKVASLYEHILYFNILKNF